MIPLWRDANGAIPNITIGLLDKLTLIYHSPTTPDSFMAYCYAILACTEYARRFATDLSTSSPRIPITTDAIVFKQGVELGRRLIWIQTYGERFAPDRQRSGYVLPGGARAILPVSTTQENYPKAYSWEEASETLHVGDGTFAPVSRAVWEYEISGFHPIRSWLGYRMREPTGRTSSPLDDIRPKVWPAEFTEELLELLWVLEHTTDISPDLASFLDTVLKSEILTAEDIPMPTAEQREAPTVPSGSTSVSPNNSHLMRHKWLSCFGVPYP